MEAYTDKDILEGICCSFKHSCPNTPLECHNDLRHKHEQPLVFPVNLVLQDFIGEVCFKWY